jgi:hypothetical protein
MRKNLIGMLDHTELNTLLEIDCSGLLTPDTSLGEHDRHIEMFDDQATTYLYHRIQA